MERCFYLLSTEHLSDRIWFQNDEDFKAAMNIVAIASFLSEAIILDFVLMSNHVHFVLTGTEKQCCKLITEFKRLYGMYQFHYHGIRKMLKSNDVDIRQVEIQDESLKRAIAYVQMNPVAANICLSPEQYPWGCGGVFFNKNEEEGRSIGSFSKNAQKKLLHSKVVLPPNYMISKRGYVIQNSYVPVKFVEALFNTPKSFHYFMTQSSKAKKRLEKTPLPAFRDQIILAGATDLCQTLFRKNSLTSLERAEKAELLKQLRYRFSADLAQLARVTGIPYSEASILLEEL